MYDNERYIPMTIGQDGSGLWRMHAGGCPPKPGPGVPATHLAPRCLAQEARVEAFLRTPGVRPLPCSRHPRRRPDPTLRRHGSGSVR